MKQRTGSRRRRGARRWHRPHPAPEVEAELAVIADAVRARRLDSI